MRTDEICERYSEKSVGLTLRLLNNDNDDPPNTVLIEGDGRALQMLAELLIAIVEETASENFSFSISPFGAGKMHFSASSELGFYINRLPD